VPALLGCLNAALADLHLVSSRLLASRNAGAGGDGDGRQRRLTDLGAALREAEAAAEDARMLAARAAGLGAEADG
jgi:hypothetical protein